LLADLRRRTAGGSFTRAEVISAGEAVGADLASWLDLWIEETGLPGFVLGEVRYHRLRDADDGTPRYQLVVPVQNPEEPPGLVRLQYFTEGAAEGAEREQSAPVRVPGHGAIEIGLVSSSPLRLVRVAPYFSLNRDPFAVELPALEADRTVDEEPFSGSREIAFTPADEGVVLVDDLDSGFETSESRDRGMLRLGGKGGGEEDEALDQGLPIAGSLRPPRWSRLAAPYAFGRYRRTMAVVRAGEGQREAVFRAEIPAAGSWQLEYYLPRRPSSSSSQREPGTWNVTVEGPSLEQKLSFDAKSGESGWNALGTFDLTPGEVLVRVSDTTDGAFVVADAIRWLPGSQVARR
jgi:hypothetical protein